MGERRGEGATNMFEGLEPCYTHLQKRKIAIGCDIKIIFKFK